MHSKSLFFAVAAALFATSAASPIAQADEPPVLTPAELDIDATTLTEIPKADPDPVDMLGFEALQSLLSTTSETENEKRSQTCSLRNVAVRREW